MFRDRIKTDEVKTSHDLSGRINMRKHEKIGRFDDEYYMDLRIEMKYAG